MVESLVCVLLSSVVVLLIVEFFSIFLFLFPSAKMHDFTVACDDVIDSANPNICSCGENDSMETKYKKKTYLEIQPCDLLA